MKAKVGSGRLIGGLIVIALGGLFLLDSLDILDFGEIIGWAASIALIAFGLGILITRRFRQVFFPVVLIVVGLFLLLGNLGVDSWRFWPVILIVVGAAIIFGGTRRRRRGNRGQRSAVAGSSSTTTTMDSEINVSCTLGETSERVTSDAFAGGAVNITMGSANLDLRDAQVVNPPAQLDVSVAMGELNLRVPSDWIVEFDNVVTLGDAEDRRARTGPVSGTPHLVIVGKLTMGSLTIDD